MFIAIFFFLIAFASLVIVLVSLESARETIQQRELNAHKQRVAKRAHRRMRINGI